MSADAPLLEDKIKPLDENYNKYYTRFLKVQERFETKVDIKEKENYLDEMRMLLIFMEKFVSFSLF